MYNSSDNGDLVAAMGLWALSQEIEDASRELDRLLGEGVGLTDPAMMAASRRHGDLTAAWGRLEAEYIKGTAGKVRSA